MCLRGLRGLPLRSALGDRMAGRDANDPRREDRETKFVLHPTAIDDQPVDLYSLGALLFALFAVVLKIEMYSWMTLLFVLASFANSKYSTMDTRAMGASFALVALVFMATHSKGAQPLLFPQLKRWLRGTGQAGM